MSAQPLSFSPTVFPLLTQRINQMPLVYFDNAATTQKPAMVIDALAHYYQTSNANVHRASHAVSAKATQQFEQARVAVKSLINAQSIEEIIWTKGCTEALNLVAQSWGASNLMPGDEIVLSYSEHHANIVPWQMLAKKTGAIIKVLPLDARGRIDIDKLDEMISAQCKLVSFSLISNVVGKINPAQAIIKKARSVGAVVVVDAAQAVAHSDIDVQHLDCDFLAFSAHKMYGPTGVGCLYGKKSLLIDMPPYQAGGEMIDRVSFEQPTTFNQLPFKFEAGTPNIAGITAFSACLAFLAACDKSALHTYEQALLDYAYAQLRAIEHLCFVFTEKPDIPLFSFTLRGHHNHDVAAALDSVGIAVRSGHHCAMPLMTYLTINGCIRVSLSPYNTFAEIDFLVTQLKRITCDEKREEPLAEPCSVQQAPAEVLSNTPLPNVEGHADLSVEAITSIFSRCKSWDARHREIMLLGKAFKRMPSELKSAQHKIQGCESAAWLCYQLNDNGKYCFFADSDAKVIRGLLAIVLAAFNGKTAQEINDFSFDEFIESLGLHQHLSPSRGNGLKAIVAYIYQLVS